MSSLEGHSQLDIEHTLDKATPNCTSPHPNKTHTGGVPDWVLLVPNSAYMDGNFWVGRALP